MYIPPANSESDLAVLHALIRAHPLGTWVTLGAEGLIANHIPFLLDSTRGEQGTLVGHVARANPVWQQLSITVPSLVSFSGPEAYISPSWYPSKQAHGQAVPTWNYVVVHAHGLPRVIHDPAWLLAHVSQLAATHEAALPHPWQVSDAPADFIARLVGAIVGIEIPIARLEGKWKISQNRSPADQAGVVAGLRTQGTAAAQAMADLMAPARALENPSPHE